MPERDTCRIRIRQVPTSVGGRRTVIYDGYRPNMIIASDPDWVYRCVALSISDDVDFGKDFEAECWFMTPLSSELLKPDSQVWLFEGPRITAIGVILSIPPEAKATG